MRSASSVGPIYICLLWALFCAAPAVANDDRLIFPTGEFVLEWRSDFSPDEKVKMRQWLTAVGETVALLDGALPRPRARMALQKYSGSKAVPFARVLRGDDQGVLFYVNPQLPLDDFISDWTAYHEVSHLFIPFPGRSDIWFSEGIATWYQNVLQFRAGLLTEQQVWQKLLDGFQRGAADDGYPEYTLEELSKRMRETHAYMRIYWSGTLYILQAELLLRERTKLTLDDILSEYGRCCLLQQNRSSAAAIAAEFDRIAATDVFLPLYKEYAATTELPDFLAVLAAAGVGVNAGRAAPGAAALPLARAANKENTATRGPPARQMVGNAAK